MSPETLDILAIICGIASFVIVGGIAIARCV
jgi:hypothetical protein